MAGVLTLMGGKVEGPVFRATLPMPAAADLEWNLADARDGMRPAIQLGSGLFVSSRPVGKRAAATKAALTPKDKKKPGRKPGRPPGRPKKTAQEADSRPSRPVFQMTEGPELRYEYIGSSARPSTGGSMSVGTLHSTRHFILLYRERREDGMPGRREPRKAVVYSSGTNSPTRLCAAAGVMTPAIMTQDGKKTTRATKTTAAKPRKTGAKKEDAVEIVEDEPGQMPKSRRASDAVEDSAMTNAEALSTGASSSVMRAVELGVSALAAGNAVDDGDFPDAGVEDDKTGNQLRVCCDAVGCGCCDTAQGL
ncbi:hypothetical protein QBC39DRAFT_419159 [Podospora conica]|nr:hypothetical protein QBC39DRAFT_419159 [Schizothecium conicum]